MKESILLAYQFAEIRIKAEKLNMSLRDYLIKYHHPKFNEWGNWYKVYFYEWIKSHKGMHKDSFYLWLYDNYNKINVLKFHDLFNTIKE